MRPVQPFGAEQLRTHAEGRTILFVEGALDVLAWRVIDRRERLGVLPLGLPGLDGWRPEWARYARGRTAGIGFDADRAAERKVDAVNQDLWEAGAAKVQRWRPTAKDWAELVEGRRARKGAP
jgi:hypothetical protein